VDAPLVLVPVNRLDRAKGRLAELLAPEERVAIAEATLRTVVDAVRTAGWPLVILTADKRAHDVAGRDAEHLDEDPALRGLNAQIEAALRTVEAPPGGVLILHADLPLASAKALMALSEAAAPPPSVTMVRSGDGGTNAMLLRPHLGFRLAYGVDSFERHREAATTAGMEVRVVESEELSLDLDTPADLLALVSRPGGRDTRAGRLLSSWKITERMAAR